MALVLLSVGLLALILAAGYYFRSPYYSGVNQTPPQPVPFSHEHHVAGLGLDCRYCHTSTRTSDFAGVPESEICMTCHSQLWTEAGVLEPLRQSFRDNRPLRWTRVHDLPDYVRFSHSGHVNHGVPCEACHGRVDQQPLTNQKKTLFMGFCLECHRDPAPNLRPPEAVFEMGWRPPAGRDRRELGETLMQRYHTPSRERLTDCSLCHQ